jgi:hypothetical protein
VQLSSYDVACEIRRAFADVSYPGDDNIVEKSIIQGFEVEDPEREELAAVLRGKSWKDVGADFVRYHYYGLALLTQEGQRYYLPAYMLAALEDSGESLYVDFIVYHLQIPNEPELRELHLRNFEAFQSAEKQAIRMFLEYLEAAGDSGLRKDATKALDDYWGDNHAGCA